MKRSIMIEILESAIRAENTGHYSYDSKAHAERVLSKLEDAGMLPPSEDTCFHYSSESSFDHEWEPET